MKNCCLTIQEGRTEEWRCVRQKGQCGIMFRGFTECGGVRDDGEMDETEAEK